MNWADEFEHESDISKRREDILAAIKFLGVLEENFRMAAALAAGQLTEKEYAEYREHKNILEA